MNKSKLSIVFDTILIAFLTSFLIYVWLNRYIKNAKYSFFICILIYILMFFVIFKTLSKKYNLEKLKLRDQKSAEKYLHYFTYSSESLIKNYFEKLFNCHYIDNNLYKNKNLLLYINLKTKLTEDDFHIANNFYHSQNNKLPLIFICKNQSDDFANLIKNSPAEYIVFYMQDLFLVMKEKNLYPTEIDVKNIKLNKFKEFKNQALTTLTKNHFFKFIFSGISLILLSMFFPYSRYYLFLGTILIILSIACLFNKNTQETNTQKSLSSIIEKTDA